MRSSYIESVKKSCEHLRNLGEAYASAKTGKNVKETKTASQ